jgi:hypothetical protein
VPNPLLELPIDQPRDLTHKGHLGYDGPGIRSDMVPATLSTVTVNVADAAAKCSRRVALNAGLAGLTQDEDGALRPVAGWHLIPAAADINEVIDRLIDKADVNPALSARDLRPHGPAEVIALYDRIGAATLFGGSWRLLPFTEHRTARVGSRHRTVEAIIDLPDGRSIAATSEGMSDTPHWIACRLTATGEEGRLRVLPPEATLADDFDEVPVYGTSLAMLLDAALDSGGDISHLETGRLSDLL